LRSLLDWPRASKAKRAGVAVDWFVGDECGTIGDAVGVGRQLMLLVVLVVINGIIETSGAGGWDHQRRPRASEAGMADGANKVDRANLACHTLFIRQSIRQEEWLLRLAIGPTWRLTGPIWNWCHHNRWDQQGERGRCV
jgi:hypothetical protein